MLNSQRFSIGSNLVALSSREKGSVSSLRAKNHICVGGFERGGLVEPGEYPSCFMTFYIMH